MVALATAIKIAKKTDDLIAVKQLLAAHKQFDQELFDELLTHHSGSRDPKPALLHSDVVRLMKSVEHDFPELVSLGSIGKTYEGREIDLITLDARKSVLIKEREHGDVAHGFINA